MRVATALWLLAACVLELALAHTYSTSSGFIFEESTVARVGETITHESMTRRYREMVPPRASHLDHRRPELRLRASSGSKAEEAVLLLDMDKTCIYGNDANDLGIALQWMEKPDSVVRGLYKRIVSPCLKPAYAEMQKNADKINTVIYTRRPQVVEYKSCFRDVTIPVSYKREWHRNGQICFPSSITSVSQILETYRGPDLLEEERNDIQKALERLLAARDAVTDELGLSEPPCVVVTAATKEVDATLRSLNLPTDNAVLFDDNRGLMPDPKVVCVEPLDRLPEQMCARVLAYMNEHLPCYRLDDDLVDYLMGAKPEELSLRRDPRNDVLQWSVPRMAFNPLAWRVPDMLQEEPPQKDGVISPVTPHEESDHVLEKRGNHECR
eukprot:2479015-Rhodomonas_salina.1